MIRFVVRKIRASRQNKDAQEVNETTPDPGVDAHGVNDQQETGNDGTEKASEVPVDERHAESQVTTDKQPTLSSWQIWKPRILLLVAVFLPVFLETLDYTGKSLTVMITATLSPHCHSAVVATSQSNIASVFNRLDLQSYIGTAYVLGSTVFLPLFASLADVYGRYWAMQSSVVFFIIGSAISTGANSMTTLLVGRGIAGIGAAGLLTVRSR
jgi:hypothetical protein